MILFLYANICETLEHWDTVSFSEEYIDTVQKTK